MWLMYPSRISSSESVSFWTAVQNVYYRDSKTVSGEDNHSLTNMSFDIDMWDSVDIFALMPMMSFEEKNES